MFQLLESKFITATRNARESVVQYTGPRVYIAATYYWHNLPVDLINLLMNKGESIPSCPLALVLCGVARLGDLFYSLLLCSNK